jgi:hypothetical protein
MKSKTITVDLKTYSLIMKKKGELMRKHGKSISVNETLKEILK